MVGAVLGWGLSYLTERRAARRQNQRDLAAAAFVVLDRLSKIQDAAERSNEKQMRDEWWFLGGDMDRYRDAIAFSPDGRKMHWVIYQDLIRALLDHDLDALRRAQAGLGEIAEIA